MTRGQFIKTSAGAFVAAVAPGAAFAEDAAKFGEPKLRIGLLADVHVTTSEQQSYFEKALRAFDAWKCDGVLCCGDIADYGLKEQIKLAAETWFKVFPGGKGSDGRPVANLLHYGDHDMATWYTKNPLVPSIVGEGNNPEASLLFNGDMRKRAWEEYFREPWEQIAVKEVKGYVFVLNHFNRGTPDNKWGDNAPGLDKVFARLKLDPAKPFFYSQHRPPLGTNFGYAPPTAKKSWGEDDGDTTRLFSRYPNLVAFSGHIHRNGVDERDLWQGAFTSVSVPSLRYNGTRPGRENSYSIDDRPPIPPYFTMPEYPSHRGFDHQAMFMTIYESAIVIRRINFSFDCPLGPDWTIPFSSFRMRPEEKPFAPDVRAQTLGAPQFAAGAKVAVKFGKCKDRNGGAHDAFMVEFPPAPGADDYSVRLESRRGDAVRTIFERRVFSPRYMEGPSRDVLPVTCPFPAEELPKGWALRFAVRPASTFGVEGAPICTPWEFRSYGKNAADAAKEAAAYVQSMRKK